MNHLGLFEGIGGFSLAARWMGWKTLAWCECNEFGKKVLRHHFPDAESFGDITKTDFTKYANKIDIITGGFPCQPYSTAGKRLGKEDPRHLWPEMLRAITEIKPTWVVCENVRGIINWNAGLVFDEVQSDLENEGYEVFSILLPACAINAPHKRERIWFVANAASSGRVQNNEKFSAKKLEYDSLTPNAKRNGQHNRGQSYSGVKQWENFPTQSPICFRNDGLSDKLDGITFSKWRSESIKAAGNAIIPQIAHKIFKAIELIQHQTL